MVSIYQIKPKFQALLRPLTNRLASLGVTANQVTVFAAILSIVTGALIYFYGEQSWPLLLVPLILLVRMALNAIDGMLAREHSMESNLGAVLNELGDVISDLFLYLPLAVVLGFTGELIILIVVFSIISEMVGVISVQIGASRRYDGPMGKSDRAFVFGAICLLIGLGVSSSPWLDWVLSIVLLLVILTIWNRAMKALKEIS
ncbi:MAG: CDP-alcohol phosphatidyltransferase family protein [Verrucomicrobiota bacterium]|nr:CDP-alcohol phosphatidyltransferase family protein [Verrucomicrobiota bacterium]